MKLAHFSIEKHGQQYRKKTLSVFFVVAALAVSAGASAASCPAPSDIIYTKTSDGTGAIYTSRDLAWRGENPYDNTNYVGNVGFHNVTINPESTYVACSYEGLDRAAIRVTLNWRAGRSVIAAGDGWSNNTCHAQKASECRFD